MELRPSVDDFQDSDIAKLADKLWRGKSKPVKRIQPDSFKQIWGLLERAGFAHRELLLLESTQAVELYLWPSFTEDASNQHVLLLALLTNVKRQEGLPSWALFNNRPDDFSAFFRRIITLTLDTTLSLPLQTSLLAAVTGAFQSIDQPSVRKECAPLVSIGIWQNIHNERARSALLERCPQTRKPWRAASKRYEAADDANKTRIRLERSWLYTLIIGFFSMLYTSASGDSEFAYCLRFMELLSDLESQPPTRRYVNALLHDLKILSVIKHSTMYRDEENMLLRDFYVLLQHYMEFPVDDQDLRQLSQEEVDRIYHEKVKLLQRVSLENFGDKLKLLGVSNYKGVGDRAELKSHLDTLSEEELQRLPTLLGFRVEYPSSSGIKIDSAFIMEVLLSSFERRNTFRDVIRDSRLLPTEETLYEPGLVRNETYNVSTPLAIPKLNLQYLTMGDFLWRSFILSKAEAFYQIRRDLEDTASRLRVRQDLSTGRQRFEGSLRLSLPINKLAIVDVVPPKVGEDFPAQVKAEIIVDVLRLTESIRRAWESLRPGDVIFLLCIQPKEPSERQLTNGESGAVDRPFKTLRAAEIVQVLDDKGRPLRYSQDQVNGYGARPRQRRLLVNIDPVAYSQDAKTKAKVGADVYESLNIVVRRHSRENNFKAILQSIRRLLLSDTPLPSWLQGVFLGTEDPSAAQYKNLSMALKSLDFRDTFLNWQHLSESFPELAVRSKKETGSELKPPYVVEFAEEAKDSEEVSAKRLRIENAAAAKKSQREERNLRGGDTPNANEARQSKKRRRDEIEADEASEILQVSTYQPLNTGPYPTDGPKLNRVRFTPAQVEAIRSGTQPGLTVIVGPPGTGKTDVATQIINNIYHDFPQERTLLIAHSNQALNQLFQKIVSLDIDERHLLRLGHGEGELQLKRDASYSKYGRVESFLENGSRLLAEVQRLAQSIGAPGAHGNSCETAGFFNSVYVMALWKQFQGVVEDQETSAETMIQAFPFHSFFSNAPQPLFPPDASREVMLDIAEGCYRHIEKMFSEIEDIRPFEVLRSQRDKANYLLIKEARIIAMTSTYAAMRRQEIADLGFQYDNVVMEEAAQITEIEAFIPLALQNSKQGQAHLKRVVLCGDHLQNSPVVQNQAFRQYANLEQSLFLRLVRLGVPTVQLDKQGRARPSIAALYKWRYPSLGDLPNVASLPEFTHANAGFRYDYQFINVLDYKGKGETEPTPHYIQNLGEAEYAVALYMYMRLLGYPASKISILTMYAGQRALIRDVLQHRCAKNRLFGLPRIVVTVDKYQGEQNDYVIVSLVRTARVGYLRDIRRLTVALSRARLGLYILGRREVFESCAELKEAFDMALARPDKLMIVPGEVVPTERLVGDKVEATEMDGVEHLGQYVYEMTQAKIASLKGGVEMLPPAEHEVDIDGEDEPVEDEEVPDVEGDEDLDEDEDEDTEE